MNRFNLTFWGEILPGKDPEQVKARFGKLFGIDDPERIEHFFSGETITLRRNLDRKVAAEYFHKLHKLGVEAELIKVETSIDAPPAPRPSAPETPSATGSDSNQWETARREAELESLNRHKAEQSKKADEQAKLKKAELDRVKVAQQQEALRIAEQEARAKAALEAQTQAKAEHDSRRLADEKRQREAEAEQQRIAAEKARRQREEEIALREAQAKEEQQRKAEEAERKRIAAQEAERLRQEKAALHKAQLEEEEQRKAEEAERKRIAAAEAKRQREAQAALRKAQAEKERKRKAEEAEKKKIAAAEAKRKREKAAAARKAKLEEERKRKAEEVERKKLAAAEAKRKRDEEAALRKAQIEKEKQRKAKEAERRKIAAAEEKRRIAEEQALEKAAQQAERKRREAELARAAAEKAELERQRAEKIAQEKAQQIAKERKRRDAERKKQAAKDALRRKQREEEQRKAKLAEEKALAQRQQQQLREQKEVAERERELEEKAIERGAKALTGTPHLKATPAKVKSRLELPRKNTAYHSGAGKHQTGAPNLYQLRAFRNKPEVKQRPVLAREKARKGLLIGAAALAVLLLLLGRFASLTTQTIISGPTAIASNSKGELTILAGDQLLIHDRSGVASESIASSDLELEKLSGPLNYTPSGKLLLQGQAKGSIDTTPALWECDLGLKSCLPFEVEDQLVTISNLRVHPLIGDIFIADASAQTLLKVSADGELKATVERPLAAQTALWLDSGLLFVSSQQGPAISVLRYEDQAFGQQLDEILLLPPPALEREHTRVHDFTSNGNHWWVTLYNPGTGDSALYLFDRDWNYTKQLDRGKILDGGHLVNWGRKVLLFSQHQAAIKRYGESGEEEALLRSELLGKMIADETSNTELIDLAWQLSLLVAFAIALGGFAYAYLYSIRALVYKNRPTLGAEPLDDIADQIQWIDKKPTRSEQLRHASIAYGVLAVAVLVILIGFGVSAVSLVAAMIALCGPFAALQLILRSDPEHLGVRNEQIVVADHRQMYHLALGPRIHYRGPFVMIDDVVIFTGTSLLPALDQGQLKTLAAPLIHAGIRVDRKTVWVKLMESHHPVARAVQITAVSALAGLLVAALAQLLW
ncbi:MAG: hypothetical protein ABJN62_12885 [Halioglobus sp.]